MGERTAAACPEAAPSEPGENHGLAEQPGAKESQYHERNCGKPEHRDTQQHEKDGREQYGEQRGENRHPRLSLERVHAPRDPVAKQQREAGVQSQQRQRQAPCPADTRRPRERAPVQQALLDPGAQPYEACGLCGNTLRRAVHGGGRLALHPAADGNHIAGDVCIGPELDISEHRHYIAVDRTVDVGVTQDRDGATAHRSGDARIAEDRHHFPSLAFAARGTQDRHHRIGTLPARQIRIASDVDEILAVAVMPAIDLVAPLIETSRRVGGRCFDVARCVGSRAGRCGLCAGNAAHQRQQPRQEQLRQEQPGQEQPGKSSRH